MENILKMVANKFYLYNFQFINSNISGNISSKSNISDNISSIGNNSIFNRKTVKKTVN